MDSLSTVKTLEVISSAENATDDAEISIFDAEKYFSQELNDIKRQQQQGQGKPSHDLLSVQRLPPLPSPARFGRKSLRAATPSEASWNSQTALIIKNAASHRTSKTWSAARNWFFRINCCCSNGKSVRIKEVTSDSDHKGPIVLMDTVKTCNRNSKILHADGDESHKQVTSDTVVEIHRIRATEAPRQQRISATGRPFINATVGFTFPIQNSSSDHRAAAAAAAAALKEDDVGSDTSSDLFEIETFSTQTASCLCDSVGEDNNSERKFTPANSIGNVHRSRRSISANECRPATADGCDRAPGKSVPAVGGGEGKRKSNGTMLMSCRPAAAEGPPVIPLCVGERPLPAENPRLGSSQSSPWVVAGG